MNENITLDGFTSEFMASLSQDSQDSMMRRINTERLIRLFAEQIIEDHQAERIRILPDRRLTGEAVTDFLVQVDDYDFRLVLLDTPDGKPILDEQQLSAWVDLLEDNPSTAIIIAVWTTDELLALPFTMVRLQALLKFPDKIESLLRQTSPLNQVITEMIQHQVKVWQIADILSSSSDTKGRDTYKIFSEKIGQAIDKEANRRYRSEERLKAAQEYPYQQEKKEILSILQDALEGKTETELQQQLTSLPRRGNR